MCAPARALGARLAIVPGQTTAGKGASDVRFGPKADILASPFFSANRCGSPHTVSFGKSNAEYSSMSKERGGHVFHPDRI